MRKSLRNFAYVKFTWLPPGWSLLVAHTNLFVHAPSCTSWCHLACRLLTQPYVSQHFNSGWQLFLLGNCDYLKIMSKQIISLFHPLTITQGLCLFQSLCPRLFLFSLPFSSSPPLIPLPNSKFFQDDGQAHLGVEGRGGEDASISSAW